MRELVNMLPPDLNATFVTTNVPIALELLEHPNAEVIFLGNKLLKSAQMAVGAEVVQRLGQIKADLCILGTNSIDLINENNCRRFGFCKGKCISNHFRSITNIHLD